MGFFKIDVQGAIMDALGGVVSKVAKTFDADGDGMADIEQLTPHVNKLSHGAQAIVDSVDFPALAANAMIVASDVQRTISDGKAMMKAVNFDKAGKGFTDVQSSAGELITYATKAVASFQHK